MSNEPNLVLNHADSNFFVKMDEIVGFRNPKNWLQDQTKGSIKKKKIITKIKSFFEIKNQTTMVWTYKYAHDSMISNNANKRK